MSISDTLMLRYYDLLSQKEKKTIDLIKNQLNTTTLHPMTAKKDLAQEITQHYWGSNSAIEARKKFDTMFSNKSIPEDIKSHTIKIKEDPRINLLTLAVELGFTKSKSEARRILKQNGIKIDNTTQASEWLAVEKNKTYIFKQGKLKLIKIIIE